MSRQFRSNPRERMIGKNDFDFFPKEEANFFTIRDRAVLASGQMQDISSGLMADPNSSWEFPL